jgi:hypothetical protein
VKWYRYTILLDNGETVERTSTKIWEPGQRVRDLVTGLGGVVYFRAEI